MVGVQLVTSPTHDPKLTPPCVRRTQVPNGVLQLFACVAGICHFGIRIDERVVGDLNHVNGNDQVPALSMPCFSVLSDVNIVSQTPNTDAIAVKVTIIRYWDNIIMRYYVYVQVYIIILIHTSAHDPIIMETTSEEEQSTELDCKTSTWLAEMDSRIVC